MVEKHQHNHGILFSVSIELPQDADSGHLSETGPSCHPKAGHCLRTPSKMTDFARHSRCVPELKRQRRLIALEKIMATTKEQATWKNKQGSHELGMIT